MLQLSRCARRSSTTILQPALLSRRFHSTDGPAVNPRWLSELQLRIQRCQQLDLQPQLGERVDQIAGLVRENWVELLVGREGFLTGPDLRGLDRQEVAWGDMDSMVSHVNNVVYNRYAESARVNWLKNYAHKINPDHRPDWLNLMKPSRKMGLIMRSIRTDYKFPMKYPDRVTVFHKIIEEPNYQSDYILLEAIILSEKKQRVAARCFEDIVVYNYSTAQKTPLMGFMVNALRNVYRAQQRTQWEYEEKANNLVAAIEEVEASINIHY